MKENKLYTLVTSTSSTIFWYKPFDAFPEVKYQVYVDGDLIGETSKTHYMLDNLKPNHKYRVKVEYLVNKKTNKYVKLDKASFITTKEKRVIDVTKSPYNAVGDGKTMNTKSLQMAIDEAGIKDQIYFPKGVYLTGALHLHGNIEIYLDRNAVIKGTENPRDYLPKIPSRFEGIEMLCYSSLINMGTMDHSSDLNCENVLIHGEGTIESGGKILAQNIIDEEKKKLDLDKFNLSKYENAETLPGRVRPRLINISNAKNVRISGINLKNAASWNVHMIYSENIITDHCKFYSEGVWNGDGWNPDSSHDCTIFACEFSTGDDAIAIKAGKNPEGNIIGIPCKNINIFDCVSKFGHGIAIGSEISGGVENVNIWDCDMKNSSSGFEIKATKKRGGYVKGIHVRDSRFSRILFHSVNYNDDGESAKKLPSLSDCSFTNVKICGRYLDDDNKLKDCNGIEIIGFDEENPITNVAFHRITIENMAGIIMKNCENISFTGFSA
ncbi:glycosyl hydrolase family 28 protein [Oribacterium sp. WCC10]|uniref:glycosyl hydrolase family 28 protein n=1 Tax=Oribacterium sp. WCC10 TaxID=1855343 RepID=UPI0008ED35DF|nr:glycosyl hydrolase family 28 protein [Oribacterium sp. WCC10]SFG72050.1 Polygalacturonase [Oribacterium sp. WCC10]